MMEGAWAPRLRPERLIGTARVILAVFSLFAVWLDPTEPATQAHVAYSLLVAYVGYAALVAAVVWRVQAVSSRWPIVTQVVDLVFFSLFIFFTSGPGSPFNVYFVFALMCATLRWQLTGTVWTAAVALAVFIGFGVYFGVLISDPAFDSRAFIIRGVYLFLLAVLLAYIGVHEQRLLRDMWLLASWPHASGSDLDAIIQLCLTHAASLLDAPTAALVWRSQMELNTRVVVLNVSRYSQAPGAPGWPLLSSELQDRAFIWKDLQADQLVVQSEPKSLTFVSWTGVFGGAAWLRGLGARRALSVPVSGDLIVGRLFVLDKAEMSADDVALAGIFSSVLAHRLDSYYLNQQLQAAAAAEERVRLARDLHDGVLQSFAGIALRLAATRGQLDETPEIVPDELDQLQRIIAVEQRELRFLIDDLKPSPSRVAVSLADRLQDLVTRFEREWDLDVDLEFEVPCRLPDRFSQDLYLIVREGLVNAARHGLASSARVHLLADGSVFRLVITDDGRGFSFAGRYTASELAEQGLGPKTLRERVQSLNGSLTLESGPTGAAIHIVLPAVAA